MERTKKQQRVIDYLNANPEQFIKGCSNWCKGLVSHLIQKQVKELTNHELDLALQKFGL